MKVILALSLLASCVLANNPPISASENGYTTGAGKREIHIDAFYDLLCSTTAYLDPIFQQFLQSDAKDPQNPGAKWVDLLTVTFNFFPLPYHHATWIVTKQVPLILDHCHADESSCKFFQYMNWCFKHQDEYLGSTNLNKEQIVDKLASELHKKFGFDKQELLDVYDFTADSHNTEIRTRYSWKYAASKTVNGTPFFYINGVLL